MRTLEEERKVLIQIMGRLEIEVYVHGRNNVTHCGGQILYIVCVGRSLELQKHHCSLLLEKNGSYWELTSVVGPQELGRSEERVKEKMRKRNTSEKVSLGRDMQ